MRSVETVHVAEVHSLHDRLEHKVLTEVLAIAQLNAEERPCPQCPESLAQIQYDRDEIILTSGLEALYD